MRTRASRNVAARYTWDRLKVSFWFAPLVMALGAVLLAWETNPVEVRRALICHVSLSQATGQAGDFIRQDGQIIQRSQGAQVRKSSLNRDCG